MIVLDCESRDSALASISHVFNVDADRLDEFLRDLDLEAHYEAVHPPHECDVELERLIHAQFGEPRQIERVCWFHLTRTHPKSDFRDGLLPLTGARSRVWETVMDVFKNTPHEERLRNLRREGVGDFQYVLKTDPFHAGPFAFLVREGAFHAQRNGNHDYLSLPETMEDICNGYYHKHGERLYDDLKSALSPVIVKFWWEYEYGLRTALHYLSSATLGRDDSYVPNTCFDGGNRAVPNERILRVEVVLE